MELICKLDGSTNVYGIFGYPVKHSKSPTFQTLFFQKSKINGIYIPFELKPENLELAVKSLRALNIKGVNVTIPHKEEVIKYVNDVSKEVMYIGASNTLKNMDGFIKAFNTDAFGFIKGLKQIEPELAGKKVLVLGAGGASRAVIYGLINENVEKIYIANRTPERAEKIKEDFRKLHRFIDEVIEIISFNQIEQILDIVEIIVNTTSVGLRDEDKPLFNYEKIKPTHTVVDIIYKKTPLLQVAEKKGCKWQDGLPMLIYQGMKSFEIWTGKWPDVSYKEVENIFIGN
jgi:shikimate dehydrogenase